MGFTSIECMVMMIQGLPLSVAEKNFLGDLSLWNLGSHRPVKMLKSMIMSDHFSPKLGFILNSYVIL